MKLPIPPEVLDQNVVVLGKTRSGKSSVMRDLAEYIFIKRIDFFTLVDPKGDWWGLKYAADGKSPGFPVLIFGGEHADVPISPKGGMAVAEFCLTSPVPVIVDVSEFTVSERVAFTCAFLPAYWKGAKGATRWFFVDEVHNFAPKGHVPDPQVGKMLHWMNKFAAEGLGRGIHLVAASQRSQKVHNDLLSSSEALITLKVLHPKDREAIKDWLGSTGDKEKTAQIMDSLEGLQRGEGWVWSPEAQFGPERVQFPMFTSYDSFKPQEEGQSFDVVKFKGFNLDQIRERFAKLVHEAESNNPKVLKEKIRTLEQQLNAKLKTSPPPTPIVDGRNLGFHEGIKAALKLVDPLFKELQTTVEERVQDLRIKMLDVVNGVVDNSRDNLIARLGVIAGTGPTKIKPGPLTPMEMQPGVIEKKLGKPVTKAVHDQAIADIANQTLGLAHAKVEGKETEFDTGSYERLFLQALSWFEALGKAYATRVQLGLFIRKSPNGGHFRKVLAAMVAKELIYYPGENIVSQTDAGRALADLHGLRHFPWPNNLDAYRALVSTWPSGELTADILLLLDKGPTPRTEVAAVFGKSPNGGNIRRIFSDLIKLEAVTTPSDGVLALTELALRAGAI